MAISRAKKEELVAKYIEALNASDGIFVAEFKALTVAESEQLRYKLSDTDGEYMVTKNTLFKIALQEAEWPVPEELLVGQTAVAFSKGNVPGVAKALVEFTKTFEAKFRVKGGIMEGSEFKGSELDAISKMATLPEVQAQILGLLVAPATQLVSIIQSANSQIVNVLHSHIEENLKGDGDEDAA